MCVCALEREKDRKKKEEARKPVKLRQQEPACKKVKERVCCNVTH